MGSKMTNAEGSRWSARDELGFPDVVGAFIEGKWHAEATAEQLLVLDPGTAMPLIALATSDGHIVDVAVKAADAAFRTSWWRRDPLGRSRVLSALSTALLSERDRLARAESVDTGKPLSQAYSDVDTAARYFEFYGGVADKIGGETIPSTAGSLVYTLREPYGVVAHITPWNSPLAQMCRGLAPSLAAGNAVVVKPSEITPISTLYAAQLFVRAGLPQGLCNVVVGHGPQTGGSLVRHPLVRHVTFTGSVATGKAVMAMAADRIVGCSLELGGKSPTIVLPDADLEAAASAGAAAVVRNAGQSCFATTRLLVHRSCYYDLADRIERKMGALCVGHGLDDPDLGPLASADQLKRVRSYLSIAKTEGAEIHRAAGSVPDGAGYFERPVLLTGVSNTMTVAREEIFGPVQSMIPFDSEEEAVVLANDSDYGLAAGVFTRSLKAAHWIAAELDAGQVQINRYPSGGVETPFGGYKSSGIGREKGLEALRSYTQLKTVILDLG